MSCFPPALNVTLDPDGFYVVRYDDDRLFFYSNFFVRSDYSVGGSFTFRFHQGHTFSGSPTRPMNFSNYGEAVSFLNGFFAGLVSFSESLVTFDSMGVSHG